MIPISISSKTGGMRLVSRLPYPMGVIWILVFRLSILAQSGDSRIAKDGIVSIALILRIVVFLF